MRTKAPILSIPNMLSLFRLACVPVLVAYCIYGQGQLFLQLLFVSLLSDALDGYFARRLNLESELGAKLDSWADSLTYGVMLLSLWMIWPEKFDAESPWLLAIFVSYLVPVAFTMRKFGVYPSYHTWGAKTVAVLMVPSFYALTLLDAHWPFRVLSMIFVLVSIEELLITVYLSEPKNNVPTLMHLLRGQSNDSE